MAFDSDSGSLCNIYEERKVKRSRKSHVCSCCHDVIGLGSTYTSVFVLVDGRCESIKRCWRCQLIFDHLCEKSMKMRGMSINLQLSCGHSYGDIWDDAPPLEIQALAFESATLREDVI